MVHDRTFEERSESRERDADQRPSLGARAADCNSTNDRQGMMTPVSSPHLFPLIPDRTHSYPLKKTPSCEDDGV